MANEIRVVGSLVQSQLGVSVTGAPQLISQTTKRKISNVQAIPTDVNGTALELGDVVTPRWAMFQNLDASNFVEVAAGEQGDFVPVIRVPPKKRVGPVCLATKTPKARANTATVQLDYTTLEE